MSAFGVRSRSDRRMLAAALSAIVVATLIG
jgi:hypothetical protein